MHDIHVEPEAEADLTHAIAYYDGQKEGLGIEFLNEVKTLLLRIGENPRLYVSFQKTFRKAVLDRFPNVVFYQFDDHTVNILAVIHGRRNPRAISRRIRKNRK